MAKNAISEGVKALVQRHAAVAGTVVGANAYTECGNISNADPEEAIFNKGDKFTVPAADVIADAIFVSRLGTSKVPAVAVEMADGSAKVLYLSSMRKRVVEYEETPDGFKSKRDANGAVISHAADTPLYKKIKNMPTAQAILNEIAGKTYEVSDVLGPYATSQIGTVKDEYGNESRGVVGLRNTSVCVFSEV